MTLEVSYVLDILMVERSKSSASESTLSENLPCFFLEGLFKSLIILYQYLRT